MCGVGCVCRRVLYCAAAHRFEELARLVANWIPWLLGLLAELAEEKQAHGLGFAPLQPGAELEGILAQLERERGQAPWTAEHQGY